VVYDSRNLFHRAKQQIGFRILKILGEILSLLPSLVEHLYLMIAMEFFSIGTIFLSLQSDLCAGIHLHTHSDGENLFCIFPILAQRPYIMKY